MDANDWDSRYAGKELVWSATPNRFVEELVTPMTPGSALDVAAGEGRNAIWMAQQGWEVVAVDYSAVAVARARELAATALGDAAGRFTGVVGDATVGVPGDPAAYDLVLFSYLQLPAEQRAAAWRHGVTATRPGGHLLVVGHASRNLTEGYGGPGDPAVLYDPDDVTDALADAPVRVEQSGIRVRHVPTDDGDREALDTVVLLTRL